MTRPMSDQDQIAAFIAARGVTRVATGEGKLNHLSPRDWHKVVRGEKSVNECKIDPIDERHVVVDHLGREHVYNGLGEYLS